MVVGAISNTPVPTWSALGVEFGSDARSQTRRYIESGARSRYPLAAGNDGFARPLVSNRLQFAIGEPHHLQQQPVVAKPGDLGLAEGPRLVVDRRLDDFEILFRGAEDQVEIAERIEIAEIVALARQHFVVFFAAAPWCRAAYPSA
jgi:hypothetical protein